MTKCAAAHNVVLQHNHITVQEGRKAVVLLSFGEITSTCCILHERPALSASRRDGQKYDQYLYTAVPVGYKVMFEASNEAWIGEVSESCNQLRFRFGSLDYNGNLAHCSEWMANPTAAMKAAFTKATGNKNTDALNGKLLLGAHYENIQVLLRDQFASLTSVTNLSPELADKVTDWLTRKEEIVHQAKPTKRRGTSSSSSEGSASPKRLKTHDDSTITGSSEEDALFGLDFEAMCSSVDAQDPHTFRRQNSLWVDDPFTDEAALELITNDEDFNVIFAGIPDLEPVFRSTQATARRDQPSRPSLESLTLAFTKYQSASSMIMRDFVQREIDRNPKASGKHFAVALKPIEEIVKVAVRLEGPQVNDQLEEECYAASFLPALRIIEVLVFRTLAHDDTLKLHHTTLAELFDASQFEKLYEVLSKEVREAGEHLINKRIEELKASGISPSSAFPPKKGPTPPLAALRHEAERGISAFTRAITQLPISSFFDSFQGA